MESSVSINANNLGLSRYPYDNTRWPSYRYRAAEKISHHVGRLYRGYLARREIQYYRWYRYNKAATTIQNTYRTWKNFNRLHMIDARIHRLRMFHSSMVRSTDCMKSFQRVMSGHGDYEDKMVLWRLAIDLRRAHPSHTTDNCIKAILESKGDVNRAITLLGLPAFAARHFDDLPKKFKTMFLPTISTGKDTISFKSNKTNNNLEMRSSTQHNGFQGIRHLKYQRNKTIQPKFRFNGLEQDIANALEVIYFSKQHVGSKIVSSKYKRIYAPSLGDNYV